MHEVNGSYNILNALALRPALPVCRCSSDQLCRKSPVTPTTKWGGSVMAALQIKNIPTGAGDDIKMDATYAKGDTKNVISTSGGFAELHDVRWHRRAGAYQSIGFGATTDACLASGGCDGGDGSLHLTEGLRFPWCVQPQLGSVLVVEPVRQLLGCPL